jgi:hypothetical protein
MSSLRNPSSDAGPSHPTSHSLHVHPHSAHVGRENGSGIGGIEEEEHDYESLPVGAGWGVNMAAGALVSVASYQYPSMNMPDGYGFSRDLRNSGSLGVGRKPG